MEEPNKQPMETPASPPLFWMGLCGLTAGIAFLVAPRGIAGTFSATFLEQSSLQIGLSLVVASTITLVFERVFQSHAKVHYERIMDASVGRISEKIEGVETGIQSLANVSKILKGAHESHIENIFANRSEAQDEMLSAMRKSKDICLVGISLRGFFTNQGVNYNDTVQLLQQIRESKATTKKIRTLVLNPLSDQAVIRAERESKASFDKSNPYEKSGLYLDVQQAIDFLVGEAVDGKIESKVYAAAPSCFLLITDDAVYIEQYHYGLPNAGLAGGRIPIIKFYRKSVTAEHLVGHFEYVWESKAAEDVRSFQSQCSTGIAKSSWDAQIVNVFPRRQDASERLQHALGTTSGPISLVGISLRDFLLTGSKFFPTIQQLAGVRDTETLRIRCLLLDPECEQGRFRSQREEPNKQTGNLFKEVDTSINIIRHLASDLGASIEGRLYRGAPSAFIVMTEESVFVEQYHYGSVGSTTTGGKVPLFEYSNTSATYGELSGHIAHLWTSLSRPEGEWRKTAEPVSETNTD